MAKARKFLVIIAAALLIVGLAYAQPFGLKGREPEEAVKVVERYISKLGNCRIEQVDWLSDRTFLFVVRVTDRNNIYHYIIAAKYLDWKIIYDTTALD